MRQREAEDGPEVQKTERRSQGEEQQLLVEREADDITKQKKSHILNMTNLGNLLILFGC